jgi:hypothetical protein
MTNISETIIKLIDSGRPILDIAKLFGGLYKLLEITRKYPYLYAIIQAKLGGDLHCSAENEDGDLVPFSLNFVLMGLEVTDDMDDLNYYSAAVNIIIPELTEGKEMQMLYNWLDDYLSDMGAEVGQFNDGKLNNKMIWIGVDKINDKSFKNLRAEVTDEEVLRIIPEKYKD